MGGFGIDVGPHIENQARPAHGGHNGRNGRTLDSGEETARHQATGNHGPGISRAYDAVHTSLGQQLPASAYGIVRLSTQTNGGTLLHPDRLGAVKHAKAVTAAKLIKKWLNLGFITHQCHTEVTILGNGLYSSRNDGARGVVAPHRVKRDMHGSLLRP